MRRRTDASVSLGRALAAATAALAAWTPRAAEACYVCFGGSDSAWPAAFKAGILVLLFLPPAIVGGAALAIYRSIKRMERERSAAIPAPSGSSRRGEVTARVGA